MLDPRIDLANMLFEMREKLNEIEMKLWEIPHHEEPVEEYEAVFTAPAEGDYMHPDTPTHERPEGFSDAAYWDSCCQCWMEPTAWEWDTHNYCDNANCDVSYDMEANTWVDTQDWSNGYADDWYDYPESNTSFATAEVHHDEHMETAPMPEHDEVHYPEGTEAPMPEGTEPPMPEGNIA